MNALLAYRVGDRSTMCQFGCAMEPAISLCTVLPFRPSGLRTYMMNTHNLSSRIWPTPCVETLPLILFIPTLLMSSPIFSETMIPGLWAPPFPTWGFSHPFYPQHALILRYLQMPIGCSLVSPFRHQTCCTHLGHGPSVICSAHLFPTSGFGHWFAQF